MAKRELSADEVRICKSSIIRLSEEVNDLKYLLESTTLMHDKGLDYSYKKQKREYKELKDKYKADIDFKHQTIETLKDQIAHGVDIKEVSNA